MSGVAPNLGPGTRGKVCGKRMHGRCNQGLGQPSCNRLLLQDLRGALFDGAVSCLHIDGISRHAADTSGSAKPVSAWDASHVA
jgi:hypothetical protein